MSHLGPLGGAIRAGDWKLIEWYEDGKLELYNLKSDLSETKDLAQENPAETQRLLGMLRAWRNNVNAQMPRRKGG